MNVSVTLADPLVLSDGGRLTTFTLRPALAGTLAIARASIARDKRFGKEMMDDGLTMLLFSLPYLVATFDAPVLPNNWAFMLTERDVSLVGDAMNAQRDGFATIEEYRADRKAKADLETGFEAGEADSFPLPADPTPQPQPPAPVVVADGPAYVPSSFRVQPRSESGPD